MWLIADSVGQKQTEDRQRRDGFALGCQTFRAGVRRDGEGHSYSP